MGWRELASGKDSWARITTKVWLPKLGGGLASMDDFVASVEGTTAIMKTMGRFCGYGSTS